MKRRLFTLFLCLYAASGLLSSLELKEGKIQLVLHEDFGRFSIAYRENPEAGNSIPLLLDQDPRTSLLEIFSDNKILRMGESPGFSFSLAKTAEGASFLWVSPGLQVKQSFGFLKSRESSVIDAVRVTLEITNTADADNTVGAKYIFDTYLGEKSGNHFQVQGMEKITSETAFKPDSAKFSILSSSPDTQGHDAVGFFVLLDGEGVTSVDEVVLANWKRLNESPWKYEVNPKRNFNLLPYSINDSAISLLYRERPLKTGETRKITTIFGNKSSGLYVLPAVPDKNLSNLLLQASRPDTSPGEDPNKGLRLDLLTVEDLIEKLNTRLSQETPPSREDIQVFQKILEELKKRKTQYE